MDRNKSSIGQLGEDIACEFLINKKYKIIARNYRRKWGELDIVTKALDGTLVFVEVKTMKAGGAGSLAPEDNMSAAKLMKLRKTCEAFVGINPKLLQEKRGWRLDLVAIILFKDGTPPRIMHYENV